MTVLQEMLDAAVWLDDKIAGSEQDRFVAPLELARLVEARSAVADAIGVLHRAGHGGIEDVDQSVIHLEPGVA